MDRASRPGATSGDPKPDGAPPDASGPSAIDRQQALRFLTGDGKLTQAALVGLHQALAGPALMRRSQGSTPHNMAFSYPDSRNDGTVGIGPKVNDAVVRELKHLTAAEAPGLISPITGSIDVMRPVETNL